MIRAILPALLLGGCTVPLHLAAEVCVPDEAMGYVGQVHTPRIVKIVRDKTHALRVRTIMPGMMVTQDFNRRRVNIVVDEKNRVARIYCG